MTATTEIAPPEPDLTAAELLARAQELVPVLRERQPATEAAGRLLDETHEAFVEAGLYRALQPRRFGGYELGLRDFVRVMSEISRGCPSSGWVLALTSGHPHLLSHWSEEAQAELYGAAGDLRVPGRPVQAGLAVPTDGGYTVSGAWDYASGCDHSTHFMGSAIVQGSEPPRLMWLLIDRADYEIVDNWDVIGLRGTGSKRVVCEDVYVPEHRVHHGDRHAPASARRAGAATRTRCTPAACSACSSSSSAPSRSAPRAARSTSTRTSSARRPLDIPPFVLRGEVDEYQHHLGRAVGLVDLAEAALLEGADRYMDQATRAYEADQPVDDNDEETRRLLFLQQNCIRLCDEAVELVFRTGGTSSARRGHPIGNAMLALTVMRTHMGLQLDRTATNLGRLRLGMQPGFV